VLLPRAAGGVGMIARTALTALTALAGTAAGVLVAGAWRLLIGVDGLRGLMR
jgi:hypothetical protein